MRTVGITGWLAIVFALAVIGLSAALYQGVMVAYLIWAAALVGLFFLVAALIGGQTRWLLLLLPVLLMPPALFAILLFFCNGCIG